MSNDVHYSGRHYSILYADIVRELKDVKALGLYCILLTYAGDKKMAHPSVPTLASDMGLSRNSSQQVRACLKRLEDVGLIKTFPRWTDTEGVVSSVKTKDFNSQTSNGYVVFDKLGAGFSSAVFNGEGVRKHTAPPCENTPPPRVKTHHEELHIEELHNEANNSLPSLRESAAEGAALVSFGDPQAGTPTHTNHGALQPVNESDPQGRQQGRGKPSKRQLDDEFEKFWALVGRKRGKQQARKSFEKQRRTHDLKFICSQLMKAQAEWIRTGREPEYWPHPSTWLNQQLDDDYDTTSVPSQREFYEARVQMIREQHVREKAQLNAATDDVSMPAITSTCVDEDDEDDDDDDWDWGA